MTAMTAWGTRDTVVWSSVRIPSIRGRRQLMRRLAGVSVIAIAVVALAAGTADACGRCHRAVCCCVTQPACECTTVMQTCRKVVYEPQQVTCYKTCYEPVCEQKTVQCVRYEREVKYRQCTYTVCKPVWETVQKEVCETVCKPVAYKKKIQVCSGHWEDRPVTPAPCAPAACAPAACQPVQKTCRVWVPEIQEKEIDCVKYVAETVRKQVSVPVCRMVAEQKTRQVPYTVCKPVSYTQVVNCVRWVPKQVPYTVTRCVPKVVEVQVPVKVCKPVCPPPPSCAPAKASCCGG